MIVIKNLSYDSPAGERLFEDMSVIFTGEKIGLVGKNGSGKTTLLRLITGELRSLGGKIECGSDIAYMPQDYQFDLSQNISQTLGIAEKLSALEKIKNGEENSGLFEIVGNDWDIENRTRKALGKMNLSDIDFCRTLDTLSGGERIKVALASLLVKKSDYLILDEPTNNLDITTKEIFYEFIKNWHGGLLIVSHDRTLLGLMDKIAELDRRDIKIYGGNYESYMLQKETEREAIERRFTTAYETLQKNKRDAQISNEKQGKRNRTGKKRIDKLGVGKGTINSMQSKANATTGKFKVKNEQKIQDAQEKFDDIKAKIPETNKIFIDLSDSRVPNGKLIAEFKDMSFSYASENKLLQNINFVIAGPERIALAGSNGSGKTTLIKIMLGQVPPDSGEVRLGTSRVAYLDQHASFMSLDRILLENLKFISGMSEEGGRNWLAKFLFTSNEVFKEFGSLSGGERIRACLACILAQEEPPQLLILDEPTNNLDLDSIKRLESALSNFEGALIVISHDGTFLKNIGIERKISLD